MRQVTFKNFIIKYIIYLFLIDYILMSIWHAIIVNISSEIFFFFFFIISIICIPLICSFLASRLLNRRKIIADKNMKKILLITQVIIGIISYFLWLNFDFFIFLLHIASFLIGYIITSKMLKNNIRMDIEEIEKENSTNFIEKDNNNIIKKYKLGRFDDENIISFLKMNHLNTDNYFIATLDTNVSDYMISLDTLSEFTLVNILVVFDVTNIYLFELSSRSNKNIEDCITIDIKEINHIENKKINFGMTIEINVFFNNQKRLCMTCINKMRGIKHQKESLQRFLLK